VELLEPTQYTNEDDLNLSELISRQNKQFKKQLEWRQAFDGTLIDTNITRMEEDWKQLTRKFVESSYEFAVAMYKFFDNVYARVKTDCKEDCRTLETEFIEKLDNVFIPRYWSSSFEEFLSTLNHQIHAGLGWGSQHGLGPYKSWKDLENCFFSEDELRMKSWTIGIHGVTEFVMKSLEFMHSKKNFSYATFKELFKKATRMDFNDTLNEKLMPIISHQSIEKLFNSLDMFYKSDQEMWLESLDTVVELYFLKYRIAVGEYPQLSSQLEAMVEELEAPRTLDDRYVKRIGRAIYNTLAKLQKIDISDTPSENTLSLLLYYGVESLEKFMKNRPNYLDLMVPLTDCGFGMNECEPVDLPALSFLGEKLRDPEYAIFYLMYASAVQWFGLDDLGVENFIKKKLDNPPDVGSPGGKNNDPTGIW